MLVYGHFRPQLDWIGLPRSSTIPLDFIGRFETLGQDFAQAASRIGFDEALPVENKSRHGPYRDCYSAKMRDVVSAVYAQDIAALDYRF